MKRKSVLVGLLSLTAVLGLASCGGNNSTTTAPSSTVAPSATTTTVVPSTTTTVVPSTPSSTVDPTEETKELIDTALSQLEISGTIESSTLTLKTTGIGGVRFSYTSSNPDVISITEGAATVNRPAFGEEDATVTITAIGILDDVESSKTFTVTVKALVDDSISVSEIKSSKTGTAIKAHGVVSGIVFASNDETGEKYRLGFYLTDSTGTIYVYGPQVAANVSVGNEVYFSGSADEHNSIKQISSPANLKVLSETSTVDWTSVIKDKTIVDVKNLGAEACGNVYELTILVYKNFNVYAIEDIDYQTSKVSLNEYFYGSVSTDNTDYAPWLQGKEGQILKVYFMVNSLNKKGVPRGNVLNVLPLSETEQEQYISKVLPATISLENKYTEITTIDLPTVITGYESYSLAWSLGEKSTGATIENGKLTITPTDSLQKFTLTVTASREGAEPVTYSFAEVQVKNSFEPMTFAEYNALANNASCYIEAKLVLNVGQEYYFVDKDGNYYLVFGKYSDVEVGKVYFVNGSISIYNSLRELKATSFEESTTEITIPAAKNITESASVYSKDGTLADELQNQYVTITGIASAAKELTVNGTVISLYGKNSVTVELTTGHSYTITGYASLNKSKTQIVVYSTDSIVEAELTPEQKVNTTVEAIKAQFAEKFTNASTTVTLNNEFNLTITVTLGDGSILSYADGVMTVTATATEATQTFTVKVATGTGVEKEETITVSSLYDSVQKVTITKTVKDIATSNSWENSKQYNSIALDDNVTVTITGGQNSGKYYDSGNEWRTYQNESPKITISSTTKKIISVKITYAIKNTGILVDSNNNNITSDTVVTVNANSVEFSVGNTSTAMNGQVKITAFEVIYEA